MIEFKISAPGKVILHGEHAVVYGKTAVAASLDLRTTLEFTELPDAKNIKIEFPNILLFLHVPLHSFQDYFHNDKFDYSFNKNNDLLHDEVQHFVNNLAADSCGTYSGTDQEKSSLRALFYLLVCIANEERIDVKPFRIRLSTQLTVNAGLGSSASFAVCLAACFLHWSHLQKDAHDTFDKDDLEKISRYALNCERIMHGSPSGIDNSICTYGSIIEFRRGESVNVLPNMPSMKILLVNTQVSRNTKDQVRRVAELKESYPAIVDSILDNIDTISRKALRVLGEIYDAQAKNNVTFLNSQYKQLSTLIRMNQGLLSSLDLSHTKLDTICSIARDHAFAGKLTGAGGGGYAYILLLPDTRNEVITFISELLTAEGFHVTMTDLGCSGVRIDY